MSNTKRSPATYAQESPAANRPRRFRMRLGGILALALTAWLAVASLTGDGFAEAQTSSLSVADFDQSGLQVVALASFTAGGATTLYSAADSRWGATGSLVEGDVDLSADSKIVRVMVPNRNGSLLRLNDGGPLVLRAWFGESGAGADLTVWLQTEAGTTSFAANDLLYTSDQIVDEATLADLIPAFRENSRFEGVEYAVQGGDGWLVEPIGSGPQPYEWGTDIAIDADGVLHAVYFDAAASDLVYARREAGAWELTAIYEDGDAGRFPAIVLDADGLSHVAFIQSDSPIADDGRHSVTVLYGSPAGGEWAFEAVTVLDSVLTGFEGARRTVAIDVGPDGPVVAAIDEAQLVLTRLVDGAWVPETLLEAGADPLQVVGLALDAGGAPHLTFATTTGNGPLDGEVWYLEPSAG